MTEQEIKLLQSRLNKVLDKPVWEGRLKQITDKQVSYLRLMLDCAEGKISETAWAYREDFLEVIKNIVHPQSNKYISPQREAYKMLKKY